MYSGINTQTPNRIVLDAGAVYKNYGLGGQALLGATRGGASFTVAREDRQVEADGIRGAVKGLKRVIMHSPKLEFTLVEISLATWLMLTRGTASTSGSHQKVTPSNTIVTGDYLSNIALVAEVANQSVPIIIVLYNALQTGEWTMQTTDKDEGTVGVSFEGHYDTLTGSGNPPYEIFWPTAAS